MRTPLLFIFTFSWASIAIAILPSAIQPNEFSMLPAFCKAKLSDDKSDDKIYSGTIGPDWLHIHHYCFALNFTNRFHSARDVNDKKYYLRQSLDNHDYVLTHANKGFWMRPDIHIEKAKQLRSGKRLIEAIGEINKALQIKPDHTNAHLTLADVYLDLDKKTEALKSVKKGLGYDPHNKQLQQRFKRITGNEYTPALVAPTITNDTQKGPLASNTKEPVSDIINETSSSKETSKNGSQQTPKVNTPSTTNSNSNPYCRFCP